MISLNDEVKNILINDLSVSNLVGNRVYYLFPPANPQFPFLTYLELSNSELSGANDDIYSSQIEIEIDIWDRTPTVPIQEAVVTAMREEGYIHSSGPDDYDFDTKIYSKPIKFTISKEV